VSSYLHTAGSGIAKAVIVSLILGPAATSRVSSQTTNNSQPANTVSASMLRVVAEVADGYRTGQPVFFLADYHFPHRVVGPFGSRDEALTARHDSTATFGVFGPYVTTEPSSKVDTMPRVTEVRITFKTARGLRTFKLDLKTVNALFFNSSAVDKFMIPYYARVYGPDYAQKLRDRLGPAAYPKCHLDGTVPCDIGPDRLREIKVEAGPMPQHEDSGVTAPAQPPR
jgi:hypothetical protein